MGEYLTYIETEEERNKRLANDMTRYCEDRLKNKQKTIFDDRKINLAVRLYLETDLDLEGAYKIVFEDKDYYDIKWFTLDDLELYVEYCYELDGIRPYSMDFFDEIVLEDKTESECFELAFTVDEGEYRSADWFIDDYDLRFFSDIELKCEINNDKGFREWLRHNDEFYNEQDKIDKIIEDWEEEHGNEL